MTRTGQLFQAPAMRLPRVRFTMIAVAILACLLGGVVWHVRYPGRAFDPVAWNDATQIERVVRQPMADRLIARDTLRGMTRAEVVRLLGEPLDIQPFSGCDLAYYLGPERGFMSIDSECLVIRLGPDGRVIACKIVTD
jgi:hypothetical protein